jgi:general nucleoside transport system permease protein
VVGYRFMSETAMGPVVLESRDPTSVWAGVLVRMAAIALALGFGALVLASAGLPVGGSYRLMWSGSVGSSTALVQTIVASTPLALTALSVVLARRMGLWNLGGEGQLYMGALFATAVALWFPNWPRPFLVTSMLCVGAIGGAAWALGSGLLKAGLRINEIVTTVLLNFVALLVVAYLVDARWRDPLAVGFPISRELTANAAMPALFGTAAHAGLLVAVAAAFLLWFALSRIRTAPRNGPMAGHEVDNRRKGLVFRNLVLTMLASGALAGIAGMGEVSGVTHRLHAGISANYGYVGIVVAILSRFSPLGALVLALPFGALLVGGFALRNLGTSGWVVAILQGTIVAIVLATELLARFRLRWAGNTPLHKPGPA